MPAHHGFGAIAKESVSSTGAVIFYGETSDEPPSYRALYRWSPDLGTEILVPLGGFSDSTNGSSLLVAPGYDAISTSAAGEPLLIDRTVTVEACPGSERYGQASFVSDGFGGFEARITPGLPVPGADAGWIFNGRASFRSDLAAQYSYETPAINGSGDLAFLARIYRDALCVDDPYAAYADALFGPDGEGGFTLVAMPQDPVPVAGPGSVLLDVNKVDINDAGEVAFIGHVRIGPSGPEPGAIYRWDAAQGLRLVALAGGSVGDVNGFDGAILLGEGGHVAFTVDFASKGLLVEHPATGLEARVLPGDTLPGLPDGVVSTGVFEFALNALGDVAFASRAASADFAITASGVWAPDASGALALRLQSGQPAPFFGAEKTISDVGVLALDDQRDVLIRASVRGPGGWYGAAYYLVDVHGRFRLIARDGDAFEFAGLQPVWIRTLHHDRDLEHFSLDVRDSTYASVALFYATAPEPDAFAAAFAALSVVAGAAWRRARR